MNLSSALDYFIAITGILIIVTSFAWNIYEVFMQKSIRPTRSSEHAADSHTEDSAIR